MKSQQGNYEKKFQPGSRLLVLCLMLCFFPQSLFAGTAASVFLQRAEEYYSAGRYLEALSFYNDCVNNSDTVEQKAAALFGLGRVYDRYFDDPERALAYYKNHIQLQGRHSARALDYSARLLVRHSRFDEAQVVFYNLIRNHPAYSAANCFQKDFEDYKNHVMDTARLFDHKRLELSTGMVEVLIYSAVDPLVVKGSSGLYVVPYSRDEIWNYRDDELVLHADNNSLFINNVKWAREALIIQGEGGGNLEVNGRRYRSRITVRADNDTLQVINHVMLDHYLYGVLPREVYASWPPAALQAQAVAARTYVLYHMLERRSRNYDVLSTTASQVYGGLEGEHPATNRAVDETSGMVLFNDQNLALTLYHANSGGVVEAVEDVWGVQLPHLQRVIDIPSLQGRHVDWSSTLENADVVERFEDFGLQCGQLETIEVVKRSPSGRVQLLVLKGQGRSLLVSGNSLRLILGPSVVKSTRFIVERSDGAYRFTGHGYGHGVGMSQWGAWSLATNGAGYREILEHYYPGAQLIEWKPVAGMQPQ